MCNRRKNIFGEFLAARVSHMIVGQFGKYQKNFMFFRKFPARFSLCEFLAEYIYLRNQLLQKKYKLKQKNMKICLLNDERDGKISSRR